MNASGLPLCSGHVTAAGRSGRPPNFDAPTGILSSFGWALGVIRTDGRLAQMTKDDTFVQMLVDEGVISAEEASSHPRRAVITKAVQGDTVTASRQTVSPRAGDRWLLCSDGLSNVVREDAIAETLTSYADLGTVAQRLVELALSAGGPDNITVVVADVVPG